MKTRFTLIILFLTFPSLVIGQSFGYKMVTIKTVPSGAELFLNGQSLGESPATVRVQDGLLAPKYMVRAELPGYKKSGIPTRTALETGSGNRKCMLWNILCSSIWFSNLCQGACTRIYYLFTKDKIKTLVICASPYIRNEYGEKEDG